MAYIMVSQAGFCIGRSTYALSKEALVDDSSILVDCQVQYRIIVSS